MKPLLALVIACLVIACLVTGCLDTTGPDAATNLRNDRLNQTAGVIAQKVASVAFSTVLNAAVSRDDSDTKQDYLSGLATGFRSQEGSLLTSADVSKLVSIWTPEKPHWEALAGQLAGVYATANPKTPAQAQAALEAIATGLDSTLLP